MSEQGPDDAPHSSFHQTHRKLVPRLNDVPEVKGLAMQSQAASEVGFVSISVKAVQPWANAFPSLTSSGNGVAVVLTDRCVWAARGGGGDTREHITNWGPPGCCVSISCPSSHQVHAAHPGNVTHPSPPPPQPHL